MQAQPLILTLMLDEESQAFFNTRRRLYFPPERNFLDAHLTLFHKLPAEQSTYDYFNQLKIKSFSLQVSGLFNLGAGVAYRLESPELMALHGQFCRHFSAVLIPQDRQGFRPHITVQNKVSPAEASQLLHKLTTVFEPFKAQATGLKLWTYLGGPWRLERNIDFCKT